MGKIKFAIQSFIALIALSALVLVAISYIRQRPQDLPWTALELDQPIGMFTGRKLAGLKDDYGNCQKLLDDARIAYRPLPPTGTDQCRRTDNITMLTGGRGRISYIPAPLAPSCPMVAALTLWEDQVVQRAAIRAFDQRVVSLRHFGSYSCRKIAGGERWSEHATANALDVAAFVLADGTTISLSGDWNSAGEKGRFLREIRDGSCELFATVLSPDYNAAHADHFHFDQASRGAMGYRLCR